MSTAFDSRRDLRRLMALNRVFTHAWHKTTLLTPPPALPDGPLLVTPNHISGLDPALVQGVLRRPVVWMMTAEYYDVPWLKPLFRKVEAIRVDKSASDSTSVRAALSALKDGRVVGIFPEGGLQRERRLRPLQPGVATLAQRLSVPILPVWIEGPMRSSPQRNMGMWRAYLVPHHVRLAVGPVLPPPAKRTAPEEFLDTLRTELLRLQRLCR